ncbi:cell division protein ZapE [Biostraticola tofi]|uniref:Cell division protein ZapE n=1 Tax=Biostraticola tofi TaxID=466109 RepID=A0A4R3Z1B4_9GAMM|nr:cell division protein ZapE [Biostraticola tofi]TCV98781.1 cell division protein ZapE [Biostraticola tofi]
MSASSPLTLYQRMLTEGEYKPDAVQALAVGKLDSIYHQLLARRSERSASSGGLLAKIGKSLLGKSRPVPAPVTGLYMWGGVGRGKTWLMDLFYRSLPPERKMRLHFHRFMLRVHEEMNELQGHQDPLEIIADRFRHEADVLCFDEFFVSDITDAMLLGTLMQALFARGITLITTSNIPPDNLYHNGLQRSRFLPAIKLIKQHCETLNVDAGIDYRMRTLTQANLYLTPLNADTRQQMDTIFSRLAGSHLPQQSEPLIVNHRPLQTIGAVAGVVALDFSVLCAEARSQNDYIALSRLYHSVLLYDVHAMGNQDENTARRFLALIDEFYERQVKLVIAADVPMDRLYSGAMLKFEYRRCLSRLQEMQSEEYLSLPHHP